MQISAERLVDKMTQKVAELTLKNAILELQLELLKKGGEEDVNGPDREHHGNADKEG